MPQPDDRNTPMRRVIARRNRGSAGSFTVGGARSSARSMGAPRDVGDEVDDAIDPERMNADAAAAPLPPSAAPVRRLPGAIVDDVQAAGGSAAYSREMRLHQLHRMLNRKIPIDAIAQALGVSVSTIEKDRVELKKRLREISRDLDIDEMIGDSEEFYSDIQAMALRIASTADGERAVPVPMRLAAMRTALASRGDRARLLQTAGVFDAMRYRRQEDGSTRSDVQRVMERTDDLMRRLLEGDPSDGSDAGGNAPRRRSRRGEFKDFSADDTPDPEVLEM